MNCPLNKDDCGNCHYYEEQHRFFYDSGPVWKPACSYYWPRFERIPDRSKVVTIYNRFDQKQLDGINYRFRNIEQNYLKKKVRKSKYD